MKRRTLIFTCLAALILVLSGCGQRRENIPYEPDTPAPAPLDGVFVSAGGTMTFNGDGSTVILDLTDDFAQRTGLPANHSEGTYDFTQDLPPHGRVSVRSDTAHSLDITIGTGNDRTVVYLDIGFASEDGSTYAVYVGAVTEERIPILLRGDVNETVLFQRQSGAD